MALVALAEVAYRRAEGLINKRTAHHFGGKECPRVVRIKLDNFLTDNILIIELALEVRVCSFEVDHRRPSVWINRVFTSRIWMTMQFCLSMGPANRTPRVTGRVNTKGIKRAILQVHVENEEGCEVVRL